MIFQSTLPRRERHFRQQDYVSSTSKFQSTLPRRERRQPTGGLRLAGRRFQSTLPRRERRRYQRYKKCYNDFNPHSHEGSDVITSVGSLPNIISIHTPTKGATSVKQTGCNSGTISIHTPTKGATFTLWVREWATMISIHTPTKGATNDILTILKMQIFQSTLPRRERRAIRWKRQ